MPEGDDPMRGSAAPTSPGAWDARSEALLGAPALRAGTAEEAPPGIVQAPGAATATPLRPHPTAPALRKDQEDREDRPAEPPRPPLAPVPAHGSGDEEAHGDEGENARGSEGENAREGEDQDARGSEDEGAHGSGDRNARGSGGEDRDEPSADRDAPAPAPDTAPSPDTAPAPPPPPAAQAAPAAPRPRHHGAADPVRVLMHRHRDLCERAVDPLDVAAGLEARGFTDRTAARYRHRDVFSLAEELYARVPRRREETRTAEDRREPVAPWALAVLAPGAVAALAGLGLALTHGSVRAAVGAAGALGLGGALFLAVRRGPLRAPGGRTVPAARLWTLWLLAYAAGGDGLLGEVLTGGPDDLWELTPGPLLGLALAVAPAAWCAHLFARRARRRIADSRGLADFAAAVRPLLLGTVTLQLLALAALLLPTGAGPGALALGALLLLARLLTVHGHPETASAALAAACAAEALALASVLSARLPVPGFDALAVPVRTLVDAWGPGAVPTLVCGAASLGLLAHATGSLVRASAHAAP
ncbi:hypothetical protein [Streptomyces sp. NPDC088752]|uniref:hypothetical protein n=1 Tax=Streptomyces sp. NPDC088752 TaxID=3154963 RepID=UPI00341BF629